MHSLHHGVGVVVLFYLQKFRGTAGNFIQEVFPVNTSITTRRICEGAICVALAIALSYLKIPIGASFGGFGGSVDLVMLPLIVYAMRWGCPWGVAAGFVFGTLKYFFAEGTAISWVSIIFDYSVAYAFVGFAGLLARHYRALPLAAFLGCLARFAVHYLSGVTVYAQYMPEEFLSFPMTSPAIYSLLYNGTYMLPNTVLAVVLSCLLIGAVQKLPKAE